MCVKALTFSGDLTLSVNKLFTFNVFSGEGFRDEATVYRSPSYRETRRSRPYADPYLPGDDPTLPGRDEPRLPGSRPHLPGAEDPSLGDLSPWSVDDSMRRILYDGSVLTVSV